jgi:hypothetical protein
VKAYRNIGGVVQEVQVDVGIDGKPLLPPDTTTDPKPTPMNGYYVTVVGNSWVQIPIPQPYFEFSYLKQQALDKLKAYKNWYLEQPITVGTDTFDNDDIARNRMIQAIVIYNQTTYLPPAWITADNRMHPLTKIDDLLAISSAMQNSFSNKFFEMETIRQQILSAQDEATLNAIVIPAVPTNM